MALLFVRFNLPCDFIHFRRIAELLGPIMESIMELCSNMSCSITPAIVLLGSDITQQILLLLFLEELPFINSG